MKSELMRMLEEGRIDDVVQVLENELRSDSDNIQVKEDLALAYSQGNKTKDAIRLYEEILQKTPNEPRILVNLGFCYMGIDDHRAIDLFDKICQQARKEPVGREELSMALTNLGVIYEKYSYYETAHDKYVIALHISPKNPLAAKYLQQLEGIADQEYGPIGLRRLENGTEVPCLWDGSHFKGKTRDIDISDIKLK